METMIASKYIVELLDKNQATVEKAHIVLDRIIGVTAQRFPNADIRVDEKNQVFMVQLTDNDVINMGMDYSIGGVIVAIGNKDDAYARIVVSQDGVLDEQYKMFPNAQLRGEIREYFSMIGDLDFVSPLTIPDQPAVPDEDIPTVESEEVTDDVEVHATGGGHIVA